MTDFDRFCIYCQKEFKTPALLVQHIHQQHEGTYAAQSYPLPEERRNLFPPTLEKGGGSQT